MQKSHSIAELFGNNMIFNSFLVDDYKLQLNLF